MASNAIPQNAGDLTKLCTKNISGLEALGQSLEITQVTAISLQARLTAFTSTNTDFNNARKVRQNALSACTAANQEIEAWLTKARSVLVPYLGNAWSAAWAEAGFTDNSTAVPRTVGDRFQLIGLLAPFLAANPNYEDPDPKVKVTAAEALRLQTQSTDADAALNPAETAAGEKKKAREAALADVTDAMRMLIRILDGLLDADDPRWATFGLNEPGAVTTPAAPTNLTVTVVEGPALLCQCEAVPTATRYRWRMRAAGAKRYRLATGTTGPLVQIDGVMRGETVEMVVQAVSGSAQSAASDSVRVTIPAAVPEAPVREAAKNGTSEPAPRATLQTTALHLPGNALSTVRTIGG